MSRLLSLFSAFFARLDASARPSPAAERVMLAGKPPRELDPLVLFSAGALLAILMFQILRWFFH